MTTTGRRAVGLYIHLPFCASRCAYCTFVTSTDMGLLPRTVSALCRELELLGRRGGRPLTTLYLGGGTPSLLPEELLEQVFRVLDRHFPRLPGAEVTLEANPDDVTQARAAAWTRLGVNRVSVGVQAFCDPVLRLRPGHVSVYLLEMDKPHALGRLAVRRPDLFPDPDAAADQYLAVGRALAGAGYRHYEVSNFALPGRLARHNLRYWRHHPVLSAGLAAHGQSGRRRWAAPDELPAYLEVVEGGRLPRAWSRGLGEQELLKERVMLGLRLAGGVREGLVEACAAEAPPFRQKLEDFLALGLARRSRGRVRLSPKGWLISNELFAAIW